MSKDPKVGTGKKPKGSDRRLYTDENPKDTVSIKFATPSDARATVNKVKNISKPFARKIQILTVGEQRAKVMKKFEVANIFKKGKDAIRKKEKKMAWFSLAKIAMQAGAKFILIDKNKNGYVRCTINARRAYGSGVKLYQGKLLEARQSDWKDEFVLFILSAPLCLLGRWYQTILKRWLK